MQDDHDASDAELVGRCRQGEAGAWAVLVARYRRLIFAIPRRAGLPEELAADVFQSTFTQLHRHLDRLTEPSRLHAWLVTTAKRETLRTLRSERRFAPQPGHTVAEDDAEALERLPDTGPLPEEALLELEERHQLRLAFARMDARCQRLLARLYLAEDPPRYDALARELGCAVGSIGPTRARCLLKLRQLLEKGAPGTPVP